MGYSYAVVCKSPKHQKKMISFLDKHFKMPDGFEKHEQLSFHSDLSYCHFKNQVGCDHGPISMECRYIMETVLRWIALKVGRKHKTFKTPYVNYDNELNFPVKVTGQVEKGVYCCTELGISTKPASVFEDYFFMTIEELRSKALALMEELEKEWNKSCII